MVDLDVQVVANCGEVVWLRHVPESVVLQIEVYQTVAPSKNMIKCHGRFKDFP